MAILKDLSQKPVAAATPKPLDIRVSEKGGVSVYGLQRFPVTLYREQWESILSHADEIRAFIDANGDKLKTLQTGGRFT